MIDCTGKDRSWWPDLRTQTAAIMAGGPSITREQCDWVQWARWYSVAINESWRLAPWADALYGCDWQWWRHRAPVADDYAGLRIVGAIPGGRAGKGHLPKDMQGQAASLRFLPVIVGCNEIVENGDAVGSGANGAFQAFNWLIRCGAKRIVLLGADCRAPNDHWHGRHEFPGATIQRETTMQTWLRAWRNAQITCERLGISVWNCAPGSAIRSFPAGEVHKLAKDRI